VKKSFFIEPTKKLVGEHFFIALCDVAAPLGGWEKRWQAADGS
jgi:hypothetical protein